MATIKEHCCGADAFFDHKRAVTQYADYLKKGPTKVTARMIQQLENQVIKDGTLLDIGGGIGALAWWFLEKNGARTTAVEASSAYLELAEKYATEQGWEAKARFIFGDFAGMHNDVPVADFVTLDKVVCCYPEYRSILQASCQKANGYLALSYPMDGFLSRIVAFFAGLKTRLKADDFKPYIHPVVKMRQLIKEQGFERVAHDLAFPWHVETYRRVDKAEAEAKAKAEESFN